MTGLASAVLVVVDVQVGFVRSTSQRAVPVIADLVARWQAAGGDTVFTRYLNHPGSQFERLIGWSAMQPSSPEIELAPELQDAGKRATAIIDKHTYSSLTPELVGLIREHGWTDLYVCGIATESCVLKTAVDAFKAKLTPWVITDASASRGGSSARVSSSRRLK